MHTGHLRLCAAVWRGGRTYVSSFRSVLRISEWIIYTEFEFGIANLESYSDDLRFFQNQSFPAFGAVFCADTNTRHTVSNLCTSNSSAEGKGCHESRDSEFWVARGGVVAQSAAARLQRECCSSGKHKVAGRTRRLGHSNSVEFHFPMCYVKDPVPAGDFVCLCTLYLTHQKFHAATLRRKGADE